MTSLHVVSKCLLIVELRFDAKLHSNIGNENSGAGLIKCSHGPQLAHRSQVPHPWFISCVIQQLRSFTQTVTFRRLGLVKGHTF